MIRINKIQVNLWFHDNAEEAVTFYTQVFRNSKTGAVTRYVGAGHEIHGMEKGTVMTIDFELEGQQFVALNGGPHFKFNEAVSFIVNCDSQEEIDYYWNALSEGGDKAAQQCGWLKDKFGVSWQITPVEWLVLFEAADEEGKERLMTALLKMKKIDISELRKAAGQA
jgi:predicted 3-demethylubiquinone-9 3-methyltransferase (glyoxalase superfamily)